MASLKSLPNELFLQVLEHVADQHTLAEAVPLRRLDRRFRDCVVPMYTESDRMLHSDQSGRYSLSTAAYQYLVLDISVRLIARSWDDPLVVAPHLAHRIRLLEQRICHLIPTLSLDEVHRKFCEYVIRLTTVRSWYFHPDGRTLQERPTFRAMLRSDTAKLYTNDRNISSRTTVNAQRASEPPASELQALDKEALTAAIGLGLVDACHEALTSQRRLLTGWHDSANRLFPGALVTAATMGQVSVVTQCLGFVPDDIRTALHAAACNGHSDFIQAMLSDSRVADFVVSELQQTASYLLEACCRAWVACAELLVQFVGTRSTGPVAQRVQDCKTCTLSRILVSVCSGQASSNIIELLIKHGAGVNGNTCSLPGHGSGPTDEVLRPLVVALSSCRPGIVRTLLRLGADASSTIVVRDLGDSCAVRADDVDLLRQLGDAGADVADPKVKLLVSASRRGALRCVAYLLDTYPDRIWLGRGTPKLAVYAAANRGHVELLRLLITRGGRHLGSERGSGDQEPEEPLTDDRIDAIVSVMLDGAKLVEAGEIDKAAAVMSAHGLEHLMPI